MVVEQAGKHLELLDLQGADVDLLDLSDLLTRVDLWFGCKHLKNGNL